MANLIALLVGALFGAGLAVSGMVDPGRVRGFLDIFGAFDPTLIFVMGGALAVMFVAERISRRRSRPWAATQFHRPTSRSFDGRLIGGAILFGIGWGMAGFCPGPGIAAIVLAPVPALAFTLALLGGMTAYRFFDAAFSSAAPKDKLFVRKSP
jgi:uncharacterized protein